MASVASKEDKYEKVTAMSPQDYLHVHKVDCEKVWRVWSPGESDFGPYETILFTTSKGLPRTAVIVRDTLVCRDGWDLFFVECY